MKRDIFIYSVDWFQYYCHQESNPQPGQEFHGLQPNRQGYISTYKILPPREFSPIYNEHFCIALNGRPMAHCHYSPKMSALNSRSASIKVENSLLYSPDWCFYLHDMLAAMRWQIQNITRVDLCADFNYFHNGRSPEIFAADYLRTASKKHPTYLRVGKDKWYAVGTKYVSENKVDYLRWGTRESEVCTYLYNKSKELREKNMKPWIARQWKAAGLDVTNVWRVEFSINAKGLALFDLKKNLYKPLFATDIDTQEAVESMFHVYAKKFFHFKLCQAGDKRKKANLPDVQLFPKIREEPTLKHRSVCREVASGKTEKTLINKLNALLDSDVFFQTDEFDCIGKTIDILTQIFSIRQQTLGYKKAIANELICTLEELSTEEKKQVKPYDMGQIIRDEKKFREWYKWIISNRDAFGRSKEERKRLLLDLLLEDTTKQSSATIIAQLLSNLNIDNVQ